MSRLRVAIAQFNALVGDLAGNAARILEFAARAREAGADVLLTPELALSGYPPEDLLMRPDFYRACAAQLDAVARAAALPIVIGHPEESSGRRYNAASLLTGGRVAATYRKHRLPNYEVFDEERYFDAGREPCVIELKGVRCGLAICADVWESGAAEAAAVAGAELMLTLNASPFHMNKQARRYEVLRDRVAATGKPVIYANLVGGQDELVFDGASFAMDGQGRLTHQLPAFVEALEFIDYANGHLLPGCLVEPPSREAETYAALKLGVLDYLGKNGFPGAIIGLSGGIDSALTLAIAVDALGADRVRAVMMPSPWTAQMSLDDSREMVKRLGVEYDEIPIAAAMEQFAVLLAPTFATLGPKPAWDTTDENLQARIRGMLLMALSNRTGRIVLKPFDEANLQPVSYDIRLGNKFILNEEGRTRIIDPAQKIFAKTREVQVRDGEEFILHPGVSVLATSKEYLGSNDFLIQIGGKSSLARVGLMIHNTAGIINPGHFLYVTLELSNQNNVPIVIRPGMPIAQITFSMLSSPPAQSYKQVGRFAKDNWNHSAPPKVSKSAKKKLART